jgi:hypothetical protein
MVNAEDVANSQSPGLETSCLSMCEMRVASFSLRGFVCLDINLMYTHLDPETIVRFV